MPVKLKKDQFTAGDMDFHVRRRFKPTLQYLHKANIAGDYTPRFGKESNQYYNYHDKKMPIAL